MNNIWIVLYPVAAYYLVSGMVYFVLQIMMGNASETYMLRQMLCSAATIPFLLSCYRQDRFFEENLYGKKKIRWDRGQIISLLLSFLAVSILGLTFNNLIAMTPLMDVSVGFQEANEEFFGGTLLYELLGSCLLVPIAEELLFRGLVYQRLRRMFGTGAGIFLSALLFGIVHANWVQFLYAGALGILLAYLAERTGCLLAAMLGHIGANLVAVLRQHTGWLAFSYEADVAGVLFTVGMLMVGAGILWWLERIRRKRDAA